MRSPFKFLDAYTLQDKEVFFGRDQETDDLYELVYKSPLILLYGMSGTGKTSLIQCGLASRFSGPDWFPLWIRRQDDINESLRTVLFKATKGAGGDLLTDGISYLFRYYLRPVYLIFDQFEELFVLGSAGEQAQFLQDIQALLLSELPVKILFVMREEYLGQLYQFEKVVPTIFDHRLRVEPMSLARIRQVIQESCKKFNIGLEGDQEQRLTQITDKVSAGKSGIQLPYLQVYLDMLYREDFSKTYPNGTMQELPALEFTAAEIDQFGNIDDVLEKFLEEQKAQLQRQLNAKYVGLGEDAVRRLLDLFVTEEGTKRPLYYVRKDEQIFLNDKILELLPGINQQALSDALNHLEENRLIRFFDDTIELAHDSLAALIDHKRTDEQRQLNTVFRQLKSAYHVYERTQDFLTRKQLDFYEVYIPKLPLDSPLKTFIELSRAEVAQREKAELERQQREIQVAREKLAAEQKVVKRQRIFLALISLVGLIAIIIGLIAVRETSRARKAERDLSLSYLQLSEEQKERRKAEEAKSQALEKERKATYDRYLNEGKALMLAGEYERAIQNFTFSLEFDSTKQEPRDLIAASYANIGLSSSFENLMRLGDTYLKQNLLLEAMEKFQYAAGLEVENTRLARARNKIEETVVKMLPEYKKLIEQGITFLNAKDCDLARQRLEAAKVFQPYLSAQHLQEEQANVNQIESKCGS